jgi:hydrogenase nickel incorporation protein HypB
LKGHVKCAVIVGDQQTDNDAKRLEGKGAKVIQIETYTSCHLNADQIRKALPEVIEDDTQLLFIENVGNLVCPAAFDLGENFKIALLSTTEGEDKAVKYPTLFSDAQIVVLTKTDLVPHLDWDMAECRKNIRQIHPGVFIFELSAKTGDGIGAWLDYLKNLV